MSPYSAPMPGLASSDQTSSPSKELRSYSPLTSIVATVGLRKHALHLPVSTLRPPDACLPSLRLLDDTETAPPERDAAALGAKRVLPPMVVMVTALLALARGNERSVQALNSLHVSPPSSPLPDRPPSLRLAISEDPGKISTGFLLPTPHSPRIKIEI